MSAKRPREKDSTSLLAAEIRTANKDSTYEIEKRTKYIKLQLDSLNEEQLTRFEFFMRSHLSRTKVDKIISSAFSGQRNLSLPSDIAIVVSGLAKLFVGELMEMSIDVLKESGSNGGLTCEFIKESYRRMQSEGKVGRPPDSLYMFGNTCFGGYECSDDLFDTSDIIGEKE